MRLRAIKSNRFWRDITAEYLILGGGGAGGRGENFSGSGGGGGGGHFLAPAAVLFEAGIKLPLTIGTGGVAGAPAGNGNPTSFNGNTVNGGGAGGRGGIAGMPAQNGTSGGGAGPSNTWNVPGTGTPGQGFNGGIAAFFGSNAGGGGGGGAGGVGANAVGNNGGNGGAGIIRNITGANVAYCAGGKGGNRFSGQGANGAANTGNGGVGGGYLNYAGRNGGNGGSGTLIIAYRLSRPGLMMPGFTFTLNTVARPGWKFYIIGPGNGTIKFL